MMYLNEWNLTVYRFLSHSMKTRPHTYILNKGNKTRQHGICTRGLSISHIQLNVHKKPYVGDIGLKQACKGKELVHELRPVNLLQM